MHQCIKFILFFGMTLYMFRTVFPSVIRCSRLYIQQQAFVKHSWFQTFTVFWMLCAFFWVIPRHLNFIYRRFGTLCSIFILHTYLPMKMEKTECSKTSAYKIQPPENYPEGSIERLSNRYCCLLASRYVQSWTPDDGWKDRPKHVEGHSKNKINLIH